ncbi:MAG: hypothetical protein HYV60_16320 [Planctomycetia bacterium]|nr:hypothetical protein [Planctomycetia bacterium]
MQPAEIEQRGSVTVVYLGREYGSLEPHAIEAMEDHLFRLAGSIDPPQLLIDCWNTDYFGSLFITALVRCYRCIRGRRGRFAMCCLQPHLRQELRAVNLDLLWPLYGSLEEAVQHMTENQANK